MSQRIPTLIFASDPITQAGIMSQMRTRPEVDVVEEADIDRAEVAVLAADELNEEATRCARAIQRNGCPRVVLVLTRLDDAALGACVELGVRGILRRSEATPERIAQAVCSAALGEASLAPDLVARLLEHMALLSRQVLMPQGMTLSGLTEREVDVLRLLADGCDTGEIADKLAYSERTVKGVIHDVTTRLQLKNRSHAVAYAMRQGLI
jgi:DNA-binding NarL/FixJ family response regulator